MLAIWQLPKAFQQSDASENIAGTQEVNKYLSLKDQPLDKADSLEVQSFLVQLDSLKHNLATASYGRCKLGADKPGGALRIMTMSLVACLTSQEMIGKDAYFENVSTMNSQNPFAKLNRTTGDGFTYDMVHGKYHKGLLSYVQNMMQDRILFVAEIEKMTRPIYRGERNFIQGNCRVGIWACDLVAGKVLCKSAIEFSSDNSSGLQLKAEAMNQKFYLELLEKTVVEVERYCKMWLAE